MKFIAKSGEKQVPVEIDRHGSGYFVRVGERSLIVDLVAANRYLQSARFDDGTQLLIAHHRDGVRYEISFGHRSVSLELHDPLAMRRKRTEDGSAGSANVTAMMPGRVVRILVAEGQEVRKGDGLLILEAMKMENEIRAPRDGHIGRLAVTAGETVERGAELVTLQAPTEVRKP